MPLKFLDDGGYAEGMIRDVPSWRIPSGGVYDSLNMIYDTPGVTRMRRGTASAGGNPQTAFATMLGWTRSDDATQLEALYGLDGKAGGLNAIANDGAATSLGTPGLANSIIGRPARHFGFSMFPALSPAASGERRMVSVAGQTVNLSFTSTAVANVVANNQQITLTGADVATNIRAGGIVAASDGVNQTYYGRVVSVETTKLFTVWPVPTVTFNTVAAGGVITSPSVAQRAGGCATSFQNRLLIGNTNNMLSVGRTAVSDRRVYYSPLPTENSTSSNTGATIYGASFIVPQYWPDLNWFEIGGSDPIIAMEPVDRDQLLILTSTRPILFSGNLVTQTATTNQTITYDLEEVPGNATCISDLGVQRTNKSVIWAGYGGIYVWNGREPVDLTDKKINTYWRAKALGANFALHGSAYVRGHYIVSYTSAGVTEALCVNLANGAWTRLTGVGTDIFGGAVRPTIPNHVWTLRWWNQAGAAPALADSQAGRIDPMFNPYVAVSGAAPTNTEDPDGAAISFSLTTRVIAGDPETQKLQQRATIRYRADVKTANITVTAQSKIDASDISPESVRTLGFLSNTGSRTISAATNASPIVITTTEHGFHTEDYVDINGVAGNTNANGRWRVVVVNANQFSLIGSSGNGAYTSGGVAQKVSETDFLTSTLDAGQGVSVNVSASTVQIGTFELHGVRAGFFEKQPVMSA